jgi:DNA-binding transcriptional LysR family regulator
LLDNLPERFPETVLELELGEGDAPLRRLMNDEAQLAIVLQALPDRHAANIESTVLGELDFVNVVRTDRMGRLLEEHSTLPQILVADFDDPLSSYGVAEGSCYYRVSNHRLKAALIVGGHGWGSVPVDLVADALTQGVVAAVAHKGLTERGRRPFSLCRKRDRAPGPVATHIWAMAQTIRE